jgi:hypothetical protein
MPKATSQRYKVISGEHETFVTENSFYAAAVLAIRMFDLKNNERPKKLGPFVMVVSNDGEYEVVDTQFVLDDLGLKYDRILHEDEGDENEQDSDSKCDKPERRNLTIFPPSQE